MTPRPALSPDKRRSYSKKEISTFAINLQRRRIEIGLKQQEIADMIGCRIGQISRYEAGVFPTEPERIIAIAHALKVDINWLFGFVPEE